MLQEWRKEECSVQPDSVQMINKDTVIIRRNIEPFERTSAEGETETGYTCEYQIIPVAEYIAAIGKDGSDNMLISMEAQAELYESLLEQQENQLTIMGALADLYEAQGI